MFESNILTFNPGWDADAKTPADFDDVRDIQARLKEKGVLWIRKQTVRPADLPALC